MTRRWLRGSVSSLILVSSLLLAGCGTSFYYVHPGDQDPSRAQVAPDQRAAVWARSVGVLLDQGYVPQVLNQAAGFISARRREDFDDDPLAKTIVTVYVSSDGGVRVEMSGVGLYTSEKEFLSAINTRQKAILDLILGQSAGAVKSH